MRRSPVVRSHYRLGIPELRDYTEVLNSDAVEYGGSGQGNLGKAHAEAIPCMQHPYSLSLTLPPLSVLYLAPEPEAPKSKQPPAKHPAPARKKT